MLLFNLVSVALVMAVAFTAIYLVTADNIKRENQQRLQVVSAMIYGPERFEMPGLGGIGGGFGNEGFGGGGDSGLDAQSPIVGIERLRAEITNSEQLLQSLLITLLCVGAGVLLLVFAISHRFASRAIQPIEESYHRQRQFTADASHELRTPLAIIEANIDAIETNASEPVCQQKEWFGYIHAELDRTEKLIDDLLYLARTDELRSADDPPLDLSRACEGACAAMEALLYEKGIEFVSIVEPDIRIIADSARITQVILIFLDNASKYTESGGQIRCTLRRADSWAELSVANTCPDIPAADLSRLFDRFYRADISRSSETGGSGLGLSIAKAIVSRAGGQIDVTSARGLTTFTMRLRTA
jgi:signal transduction histidine kinase